MLESEVVAVTDLITKELSHVMESAPFGKFLDANKPRPGDLIVFNNSFLYREKLTVKTTKSSKYLGVRVGEGGPILPVCIVEPGGTTTQFKRIPASRASKIPFQSLEDEVRIELKNLGVIIRALIGKIGEDEPAFVPIDGLEGIESLAYEPKQKGQAEIGLGTISINQLDDLNIAWGAIKLGAATAQLNLTEKFTQSFEHAFSLLRESAFRPVNVLTTDPDGSILGEAIDHIRTQIGAYSLALRDHIRRPGSVEALNDLLRIAYNFADGAQELLNLVIGVSDMKPIVFWLTVGAQSDLAERFSELPFSLVGDVKPSLDKYRRVIAGARNRTFHNVFSFARPFVVRLAGDAFKSAELRLFREYGTRGQSALDYADRQLVDLLSGFTRAAESPVPQGFWEGNLKVMYAIEAVTRSLRDTLVMLAK